MNTCKSVRRWTSVAVAALVVAGLQVVTAWPAVALPTTTVRTGVSLGGQSPGITKSAEALCPAGQVVVGGGGEILGEPEHTTVLTAVEPHTPEGLKPYRFFVQAHALRSDLNELWQLKAYALCVPAASMPGYRIESFVSVKTATNFKAHRAVCPNGLVAYSAGATTSDTDAFGLQLVRTSGPLDITRATARAFSAMPMAKEWSLTAIAVCGPLKDGIVAVSQVGPGPFGPWVDVSCPAGATRQIHGAGGGLGLTDGGRNWIRELRPAQVASAPSSTRVRMSLQDPQVEMIAHTTCATVRS